MDIVANLNPTDNLLEFYREKISQHEKVQDELNNLLKRYKTLALPIKHEEEHCQLTNEILELREALSDVNVFIHSERQQSSQLLLERERLKVDLETANKKLALLSNLTNITNEDLEIFINNPKKKGILRHQIPARLRKTRDTPEQESTLTNLPQTQKEIALQKHLELLDEHFQESKKAWLEEKSAFLEEQKLQQKELKAQSMRDQAHQKLQAARLEESQKLLQEATQLAIDAKSDMLRAKRQWLAEKDKLMTDVVRHAKEMKDMFAHEGCQEIPSNLLENITATHPELCDGRHSKREISTLQRKLKEQEELRTTFENRCLSLEQKLSKTGEEKEALQRIFKDKIRKIAEKNSLLAKQNEKNEQRRQMQAEGFSNDLKLMKEELKRIVQQFYKLTALYCQGDELPDARQLKDLKVASTLARNIHHAILQSKRRLMLMESDAAKVDEQIS